MSRFQLVQPGEAAQELFGDFNYMAFILNKQYSNLLFLDDPEFGGGASKTATENSNALRKAVEVAVNGTIIILSATSETEYYNFNETQEIDKSIYIIGQGTTNVKFLENNVFLYFNEKDFQGVKGLRFFGSGKNDTTKPLQVMIFNYLSARNEFSDLYFQDVSGACILFSGTYSPEQILQYKGSRVSNIFLWSNNYGVMTKGRAEYNTIEMVQALYNNVVFYDDSGNNNFQDFNLSWNAIGFQCRNGSNNSHGQIGNGNINHCTSFSFDIDDASTGYKITNVSMFDAPFKIFGTSKLVEFVSCLVDTSGGNFDESTATGNGMKSCTFYSASTDPRTVITSTNNSKFNVEITNPAGFFYKFGNQGFGRLNDRITTTNATLTTIKTVAMVASTLYMVSGKVTARRTGGGGTADDISVFTFQAVYIVISGTLTERAKTITPVYRNDATTDFQLNISSLNLLFQVVGVAGVNYTWNVQDLQIEETTT